MEDSIERILEDARKNTSDYWDCDVRKSCGSCPSKTIDGSCETAQSIDLVKRTRALFERQLPEGGEWPRFEDGELVEIGDAYEKASGTTGVVTSIHLRQYGGVPTWVIGKGGGKVCVRPGGRVKRAEADTQEKIDADVMRADYKYWDCTGFECSDCPEEVDGKNPRERYGSETCYQAKYLDLLRRQRELCERGGK